LDFLATIPELLDVTSLDGGDMCSTDPAAELIQVVDDVCNTQKILVKSNLKIYKSVFDMHAMVKGIAKRRVQITRTLVSDGAVDARVVERLREFGVMLRSTKAALAQVEEMIRSSGDLLNGLMDDSVEAAIGSITALLLQPQGDDASRG
ncbi:hypothetical protein GGI21_003046, partial [Coemansia aciculifera]